MTQEYRRIVRELCEYLAISDPLEMEGSQLIQFGETAVSLVYDVEQPADALFVYFDLGPIPDDIRPAVHEGMLRTNLRPDADMLGHFGVHPVSGHAVWHVRFQGLQSMNGATLASFLASQVGALDGWMDRVSGPVLEALA